MTVPTDYMLVLNGTLRLLLLVGVLLTAAVAEPSASVVEAAQRAVEARKPDDGLASAFSYGQWLQAAAYLQSQSGKGALGRAAVAAGSPHAAAAGAEILGQGGNAADAAAATLAALWVVDPANTSMAGRCQILLVCDGQTKALGAATRAPFELPGWTSAARDGWQMTPVPGNPRAVQLLVERHGKLSLSEVLAPAIRLAQDGFAVPEHLAEVWQAQSQRLARDEAAAAIFLPEDRPPAAGEIFRQPLLAETLKLYAANPDSFYGGDLAQSLAADFQAQGGFVQASDLASYEVLEVEVLSTNYRGVKVLTPGGNTWGHTLIEMLNILDRLPAGSSDEMLAWTLLFALADRPQELGTLKPKVYGLPLSLLVQPALAEQRARTIEELLAKPADEVRQSLSQLVVLTGAKALQQDYDTTHLSVIDSQGNAVALTTSIGRHFGAAVASPSLGFLGAQSYLMARSPIAGARDQTEMTPTILLRDGRPWVSLGAAGSERIPQAVVQVIVNLVDRQLELGAALARPRMGWKNGELRLHLGFAGHPELKARRFPVSWTGWSHRNHLGIVQAVQAGQQIRGEADRAYDGGARALP